MKIIFRAGLAAVLALASSAAMAQGTGSIYVELRGGVTFATDADNSGGGIVIESSYDPGANFGAAVGYNFRGGFRFDIELAYQDSEIDKLTIANDGGIGVALGVGSLNGVSTGVDGSVSVVTGLANAYWDFDTGGRLSPFATAGVGIAHVAADASALGVNIVDDSDTVLAYQGGAGIAYEYAPNWTFTLMYRYLGTEDPGFTNSIGGNFDSEYSSHNVLGGIRATF